MTPRKRPPPTEPTSCQDPLVARATELMRRELSRPWTVDGIAHELGTSRPVLARRFVEALGIPPLRTLRDLRMNHAAQLLRSTDSGLAHIASEVGYESEFAFSRAFLRHFGMRPGQYRRLECVGSGHQIALACAA